MSASPTLSLGLLLAALGLAGPSLALDLDLKPAQSKRPAPRQAAAGLEPGL